MAPPPAFSISGMACFMPRKTPLALMSISRSQASVLRWSVSPLPLIPALLTKMSNFPYLATTAATERSHWSSLLTSSNTTIASPPASAISASTFRASSSRMSAMATLAPSRANRRASSAPIPWAPPVIRATFPASLMIPPMPNRADSTHAGHFWPAKDNPTLLGTQ